MANIKWLNPPRRIFFNRNSNDSSSNKDESKKEGNQDDNRQEGSSSSSPSPEQSAAAHPDPVTFCPRCGRIFDDAKQNRPQHCGLLHFPRRQTAPTAWGMGNSSGSDDIHNHGPGRGGGEEGGGGENGDGRIREVTATTTTTATGQQRASLSRGHAIGCIACSHRDYAGRIAVRRQHHFFHDHGRDDPNFQWPPPNRMFTMYHNGTVAESLSSSGEGTVTVTVTTNKVIKMKNGIYNGQVNKQKQRHGRGTMLYKWNEEYTGDWNHDVKEGVGVYVFADGSIYEGEWKGSAFEGYGVYRNKYGDVFEGEWIAGQKEGRFINQFTDGRVEAGMYHADFHVGRGVRWSADRKTAWLVVDGRVGEKIALRRAHKICEMINIPVPL